MILAVGNYLNGSTSRGQADGFNLETLRKISDTKATASTKMTLFDFVVGEIREKHMSAVALPEELRSA